MDLAINGNMQEVTIEQLKMTPTLYRFSTKIEGYCSKEQVMKLREIFRNKDAIEIHEDDGIYMTDAIKITMKVGK